VGYPDLAGKRRKASFKGLKVGKPCIPAISRVRVPGIWDGLDMLKHQNFETSETLKLCEVRLG
jgi:hypothetical protein